MWARGRHVCVTPPDSVPVVCVLVNVPQPTADDRESLGFPEPHCSSGTTAPQLPDDPEHTPTSTQTHNAVIHTHTLHMCVCVCDVTHQRCAGEMIDIQRIHFLFQSQTVDVQAPDTHRHTTINTNNTQGSALIVCCVCLPPAYECVYELCVSLRSGQMKQRHSSMSHGVCERLSLSVSLPSTARHHAFTHSHDPVLKPHTRLTHTHTHTY